MSSASAASDSRGQALLVTFVFARKSRKVRRKTARGTKLSLQAARAHLEALLPAMAAEESGAEAPRRLELLSGIVLPCSAACVLLACRYL